MAGILLVPSGAEAILEYRECNAKCRRGGQGLQGPWWAKLCTLISE